MCLDGILIKEAPLIHNSSVIFIVVRRHSNGHFHNFHVKLENIFYEPLKILEDSDNKPVA
jgi:hypothetical protein